MVLTFLNIVVVSGVLIGLIEGSVSGWREKYTGDVFISTFTEKKYIENTQKVLSVVENTPGIENYSTRYADGGTIESNWKKKIDITDKGETAGVTFVGVVPSKELSVTGIDKDLIEGEFINNNDFDKVVLGYLTLKRFLPFEAAGFTAINAQIGDKILVKIGDVTREVYVKGIIKTKVDENDRRVFFPAAQLRQMIGRDDFNVDEIAIKLKEGVEPIEVRDRLIALGLDKYAKIETYEDAQPKFLDDIKKTFALLGNVISSIGLAVASITVFIVIFINALTRRKFIGILKGIGIDRRAIEVSYIFQSFFYAVIGSLIGLFVVYALLVPYFDANPINFPFSDGILVATLSGTMIRLTILIVITIIAGYIPARLIVRQNTLDSILGR
jgi:ABC-type lipoprotein release transport system permease subunit